MKTMYRILGVVIGLVVAFCGCSVSPPSRDYIKEAVQDTFDAGKAAGRLELTMEQLQEKMQAAKTAHEQYDSTIPRIDASQLDPEHRTITFPAVKDDPEIRVTMNDLVDVTKLTEDRIYTFPGDPSIIPSGEITEITTKDGVKWWWNHVRKEWMQK